MIIILRLYFGSLRTLFFFCVGFLVLKDIGLLNTNEKLICASKYMQIWGQIYSSWGREMPLELLPCSRSNTPQSAMAEQCYTTFFLKAFDRREQAVFFSKQFPNVLSKCFQHFRPGYVCSSKQCRTIGVDLQSRTFHAQT